MRIDIESKKRGYASLEVIAMSLIGFTLVLALLSIALNKRILIKNEIKAYEKKLDNDDERTIFLAEILSSIKNYSDEESLRVSEDNNVEDDGLYKLSLLTRKNDKFNLYFNEENNIFMLEDNTNIYYYDYEIRNTDVYLRERSLYVK